MTDFDPRDGALDTAASGTMPSSPRAWGVTSALALVLVTFLLSLLAGAVVSVVRAGSWGDMVQVVAVGGVLVGLYAALLGLVWGADAALGVRLWDGVRLNAGASARWYVLALAAAVGAWVFSAGFTIALQTLGLELPRQDLAVFRMMPGGVGTVVTVLLLVVVAPLAEEVVYRGVLLTSLASAWGPVPGLLAASVIFSAVHLSLVGFIPLMVAGAVFGWLYLRSGSLSVAIVAHAAFNALGVVIVLGTKAAGLL